MDYWHWFSIGGVLIIIEILSPTFFFLWPGMACILVGALRYFYPAMDFNTQLIIAAVATLICSFIWRIYYKKFPQHSDDPALNKRAAQMIGRTCILIDPIENGRGRASIADSAWIVRGPDSPVGSVMKVSGVEGTALVVEKA